MKLQSSTAAMQTQPLYPPFPPGAMPTGRYSPSQYARTAADMRRHCMTNPAVGVSETNVHLLYMDSEFFKTAFRAYIASILFVKYE